MKRLLSLVLLSLWCAVAWADPGLEVHAAGQKIGVARAVTSNGATFVAFDEVMSLLGGKSSLSSETYDVAYSVHQLRLIHNSTAAWMNGSILALARAPQVARGHCWVEKDAALKLLSQLTTETPKKSPVTFGAVSDTQSQTGQAAQSAQEPKPAKQLKEENSQLAAQGTLAQVTQVRFGDNGDFYRLVVDMTDEGNAPVKLDRNRMILTADTKTLSSIPDLFGQGLLSKAEGTLTLEANNEVKSFWLKEPRRLVVDWTKGGKKLSSPAQQSAPVKKEEPAKPALTAEAKKTEPTAAASQKTATQAPQPLRKGKRPFVMIDPGHGGKDTGATRGKYQEKVIALQIAQKLQKALSARGIDSRLTREGDTYPTLSERPAMANSLRADAFVSIHLNSLATQSGSARGQEIYIMALPTDKDAERLAKLENAEINDLGHRLEDSGKTDMLMSILGNMRQNAKIEESTVLAEAMYNQGAGKGIKMRRVAQAPFAVLRGAAMPAVLVETGFITHPDEVKQLADPSYQTKLAEAMAKGLQEYLHEIMP